MRTATSCRTLAASGRFDIWSRQARSSDKPVLIHSSLPDETSTALPALRQQPSTQKSPARGGASVLAEVGRIELPAASTTHSSVIRSRLETPASRRNHHRILNRCHGHPSSGSCSKNQNQRATEGKRGIALAHFPGQVNQIAEDRHELSYQGTEASIPTKLRFILLFMHRRSHPANGTYRTAPVPNTPPRRP